MFRLIIPFTRGIIHDQSARRRVIFFVMLAALVMLFLGATFLDGWLREHRVIFIFYWLVCAWLTFTALLFALYDILKISAAARRERRRLAEKHFNRRDAVHEDPR